MHKDESESKPSNGRKYINYKAKSRDIKEIFL